MINNLNEHKRIDIYVDTNKNVVIFPVSTSKKPIKLADGSEEIMDVTAYHPIELNFPYTVDELAGKIELAFDLYNVYECYDISLRQSLEEKYYGIRGFKKATKGLRLISPAWNNDEGKRVVFYLPSKGGFLGVDKTSLPYDADWKDFAETVLKYIEADYTTFEYYKLSKSQFNM